MLAVLAAEKYPTPAAVGCCMGAASVEKPENLVGTRRVEIVSTIFDQRAQTASSI
ncbi:hypothetical protein H3Z74_13350 [Sphingomonas alpina]|uniref:Uncharacterized protein n=1 Tax=Sphingomonas alpina TaxID=653931 RepID=A0A7H0LDP0_9SPHN|nr:hypothetical protein H3Z74_13350 [Sphingomonas alpina]